MSDLAADNELKTRRRRNRAFIQALLIVPIMWVLAVGGCVVNTRELMPGALVTQLPIGCSLLHFTKESEQPFRTLIFACPGVDKIRLWPLPVQPHWQGEWWEDLRPLPTPDPQKQQASSTSALS